MYVPMLKTNMNVSNTGTLHYRFYLWPASNTNVNFSNTDTIFILILSFNQKNKLSMS